MRVAKWLGILTLAALAGCGGRRGGTNNTSDAGVFADSGTSSDASVIEDFGLSGDASTGSSPLVDPMCVDGQYSEVLPTGTESLADITFTPNDLKTYAQNILARRYPVGRFILDGCLAAGHTDQECVNQWLFGAELTSAPDFQQGLSTVVHEGGHMFDLGSGGSGFGYYHYTQDFFLSCTGGDTVARGGMTFARSEIHDDAYQSEVPACAQFGDQNCDNYAFIYLDATQGLGPSQGFSSVLEEATQYVNSLAVAWAFHDAYTQGGSSQRDGISAFLWYVERYLHKARLDHPDAYNFILNNECFRRAILTVWGRAWLYLEATAHSPELEIQAPMFEASLMRAELLDEIQRIRAAQGCAH